MSFCWGLPARMGVVTRARGAVLATGFPDLNPARAVPIPRERAGFTKSHHPAGFLGNSRDTELRAKPRCTQIGDEELCPLVQSLDRFAFYVRDPEKSREMLNDSSIMQHVIG